VRPSSRLVTGGPGRAADCGSTTTNQRRHQNGQTLQLARLCHPFITSRTSRASTRTHRLRQTRSPRQPAAGSTRLIIESMRLLALEACIRWLPFDLGIALSAGEKHAAVDSGRPGSREIEPISGAQSDLEAGEETLGLRRPSYRLKRFPCPSAHGHLNGRFRGRSASLSGKGTTTARLMGRATEAAAPIFYGRRPAAVGGHHLHHRHDGFHPGRSASATTATQPPRRRTTWTATKPQQQLESRGEGPLQRSRITPCATASSANLLATLRSPRGCRSD